MKLCSYVNKPVGRLTGCGRLFVLLLCVSFSFSALARTYDLKGVVRSESGESVLGATVVVEGTSRGVTTDVNGAFTIAVNSGETLLVQFIGYVPQKGVLFSGDIASNLRYGRPEASDEDLDKAARIAQAAEFIAATEGGMHNEIAQGGGNVTGGQKQRLSIARALVKEAPIYIFDDSFSALDFKTDAALRRALKEETGNSTVLLVAQRVSTIMNAEQIVVLDEGRVAGIGTHAELLQTCEIYREIAQSQLTKEEMAK